VMAGNMTTEVKDSRKENQSDETVAT